MRIVAGRHRGRSIATPDNFEIRPTSDRVRESVFNILEHRDWGKGGVSPVNGARVLDAFCGTGACGLEALSRGAKHATFLDDSNTALDLCRQNIATLNEQARTDVYKTDCLKPVRPAGPYTLVFLDPPYRENLAQAALGNLARCGWIEHDAICVVETNPDETLDFEDKFIPLDDRKYGSTRIRTFRYAASD